MTRSRRCCVPESRTNRVIVRGTTILWLVMAAMLHETQGADALKYVGMRPDRGASDAVIVGDRPLVHTSQLLPLDKQGKLVGEHDIAAQVEQLMSNLESTLAAGRCHLDQLVKVNVYVADAEAADAVNEAFIRRFSKNRKPASSYVMTRLPHGPARVALDAVAVFDDEAARSVDLRQDPAGYESASTRFSLTPPGTRIYIAGQAEKAVSLTAATRATIESLTRTLAFLGRRNTDIVQLKAFLSPMTDVQLVEQELLAVFGPGKLPPVVYVEWTMPLIEIEMIAWGGDHNSGPVVEYLTPPDMSASPIYSRIARINSTPSIYISNLLASRPKDAASEAKDVFTQLDHLLKNTGSDFGHLAKATYYCTNEAVSRALNEIRPSFYNPQRPPSASKAMVAGVCSESCGLALDMIAVPAWENSRDEYGPAETGFGLSEELAETGWLSLFDGHTTFGWKNAHKDELGLYAGTTTSVFGPSNLRLEVARPGKITCGNKTYDVSHSSSILISDSSVSIQLDETIRVQQLLLQPLNLRPLFDGRSLEGWKRIDHQDVARERRPHWSFENGKIDASGGPGALEFTGGVFRDFLMQIDVRTNIRHANGGVFFRAIPGDFMNGYEAQIYNRGLDGNAARPARYSTGALDDHQLARRLVSRDGRRFTMTVLAHGPHIATWVCGAQMTDWFDERPADDNPRKGRRTTAGAIQLQAHDPGTRLEFSNIRICEFR